MKSQVSLAFFLLLLVSLIASDINPVQQFESDFQTFGNWSARFYDSKERPADLPFLTSDTVSPFSGHLYFDWNKQGIRVEVKEGTHSPWLFRTTLIQSSNVTEHDKDNYYVRSNFYIFLEPNKCFYYSDDYITPKNIINAIPNITVVGTIVLDGVQCLLLQDDDDNQYAIRMSDMALMRFSVPRSILQPPPVFSFLGKLDALSWGNFENIKVGPVDESHFKPPSANCKMMPVGFAKTFFSFVSRVLPFKSPLFKSAEKKLAMEAAKKRVEFMEQKKLLKNKKPLVTNMTISPPLLTQSFTAQFTLTTPDMYGNLTFHGLLAMDFHKSGFLFRIDKTSGNVPFSIQTSIIVHPDRDGIEFLQSGASGSCWSYLFLQYLFTMLIPQFQIPPSASYIGSKVIDGYRANGWHYDHSYTNPTFWVRESDSQLLILEGTKDYGWVRYLHLQNIIPSVEPNLYSRPPYCAELNEWSSDFGSHLFWDWCDPFC